jgi:hypothetical protein
MIWRDPGLAMPSELMSRRTPPLNTLTQSKVERMLLLVSAYVFPEEPEMR